MVLTKRACPISKHSELSYFFLCIYVCFYRNVKLFKMNFFILRTQEETSELTLSLSFQYDTLEICYGDSKEIVQILDMTFQ